MILFSEGDFRRTYFPYAKIECARFKGTDTSVFIDQKTIEGNLAAQAEQAYDFILRHINKSAVVEGVYTNSRWQYPVIAVREAIRNAVVHRDYALTGRDIKVAIFDDMIEITSPGKLLPSIDFDELEARQSDIRNKVIAPVFKKVGLIDQWGNGLKLIAGELKDYPEIEFKWFERGGLQFQVQFIDKEYKTQQIDGAIDGVSKALKRKLTVLVKAILNDEGKNIADYTADTNLGSHRTLERYMQQLRKGGLIEFRGEATQTGGYYLTETLKAELSKK
ncbi:ATP-binding protein [Sphingobacterium gobiense]|uniref:Uncharacterized protein n=1 Tax=Sphingobacterium gobiense TaxID=1382456 RepID=A0A2S9JU79_9SPHI|nr:ATP-binding protein [Sphingobacterium gobiense]PRD56798.1 hypothetical protein C5749_06115 [Sphingobacterium gobiense]